MEYDSGHMKSRVKRSLCSTRMMGQLYAPEGITTDDQFLYVADMGNHRIVCYDKKKYTFVRFVGAFVAPASAKEVSATKKLAPLKHKDSGAHLARIHELLHRDAVLRHEHDELVSSLGRTA